MKQTADDTYSGWGRKERAQRTRTPTHRYTQTRTDADADACMQTDARIYTHRYLGGRNLGHHLVYTATEASLHLHTIATHRSHHRHVSTHGTVVQSRQQRIARVKRIMQVEQPPPQNLKEWPSHSDPPGVSEA